LRVIRRASARSGRCLDRVVPGSPRWSGRLLTAVLALLLAVVAVGCSSNKSSTSAATTPPTISTATSSSPQSTTTVATGGLSGTWSGQYSGASQGTFTLTWQQSGSNLNGNIKLSAPPVTLPITGTVNGNDIRFGTVGSYGITYSGSVSGSSMSGTYHTDTGDGSWSANKTS
jgi:hypothetical protein